MRVHAHAHLRTLFSRESVRERIQVRYDVACTRSYLLDCGYDTYTYTYTVYDDDHQIFELPQDDGNRRRRRREEKSYLPLLSDTENAVSYVRTYVYLFPLSPTIVLATQREGI